MSNKDACNCDQAKALQSELAELRAAAYGVLAWIDRSTSVGREAARRLEQALAVGAREAELEVVVGLGKVADCPDCSSVDYCKAHLAAMMGNP